MNRNQQIIQLHTSHTTAVKVPKDEGDHATYEVSMTNSFTTEDNTAYKWPYDKGNHCVKDHDHEKLGVHHCAKNGLNFHCLGSLLYYIYIL